ncbi:MAG: hypothetical protein SF029_04655 [bacterium]|nr:hypothetical protein [bacterium]
MSKPIDVFPYSVIEKLGYYVYLLIDPETEKVFYVGKGTGNRVFAHANDALESPTPGEKLDRIRDILSKGKAVDYIIHRHGLTEKEAFEVEAALIDYIGLDALTNQVHGFNSDDRGRMRVADIIEKYAAPEVDIQESVILVTINRLYRKGMSAEELYGVTRGDWVIGTRREKAQYAFAVSNGIIRQVYKIERWYPSENLNPALKNNNRWRFDGRVATELQHYVGGSTVRYSTIGAQNPVKYINC